MKLEVSVPELVEVFKGIQKQPEQIFEMIRLDVMEIVGDYMTAMMNAELTHFLGREPYVRGQGEVNHRNGFYGRVFTLKDIGEVEVKVPRDRKGAFTTQVIPRSRQYETEISRGLSLMFLAGISTRSLSMISRRLLGRRISHTEISSANAELTEAVERWRMRDLSKETIKHLFVDGVNFRMRLHGSIELVPVLVAIGVTGQGHKLVLGMQSGDKDSSSSWREFFKDLKSRGLNSRTVILGIMDGLTGGWNRIQRRVLTGQGTALHGTCRQECPGQGSEETEKKGSC